ncbi:MAG TPA: hypothetical protein O0X97_04520 [Methanocorpusculum sp.]|nr:hypothetical protein [Methanocorpusculum sp.]
MALPAHAEAPEIDSVIAGYQRLEKSVQAYCILMAASGIHSTDFFQIFRVPPEKRNVLHIKRTDIPGMKSDVIVIEIEKPAGGNWRTECACFPPELEKAVRNFTVIYTPDHYKRSVRLAEKSADENTSADEEKSGSAGKPLAIKEVRQWNYSLILNALYNSEEKPQRAEKLGDWLTECYRRVNIIHGNIAVCEQKKSFDHKKRMEEAIVTYSYAAEQIAESLRLPEFMLNGETRFESPRISDEDREIRDKKTVEMLKAKTPAGEYVYTHSQIKKETGITSRSLNELIAKYHLERGGSGGRPKGQPKPRRNKKE